MASNHPSWLVSPQYFCFCKFQKIWSLRGIFWKATRSVLSFSSPIIFYLWLLIWGWSSGTWRPTMQKGRLGLEMVKVLVNFEYIVSELRSTTKWYWWLKSFMIHRGLLYYQKVFGDPSMKLWPWLLFQSTEICKILQSNTNIDLNHFPQ